MPKLGVNIDHVATLRQARGENEPDPVEAARIAQKAGADSIVCHLREDRRHIQDHDVRRIRKIAKRLTFEMALDKNIIKFAATIKPDHVLLVPEKRQEVTTEGGLNVIKNFHLIAQTTHFFQSKKIKVSIFIDPNTRQIKKAAETGADIVELHTGVYAHAKTKASKNKELDRLRKMAQLAKSLGLRVSAGHGLKYHDTKPVAKIKDIEELNIGHTIVSRALVVGMAKAVKEMKKIVSGK